MEDGNGKKRTQETGFKKSKKFGEEVDILTDAERLHRQLDLGVSNESE